jgi:hypothetical protein
MTTEILDLAPVEQSEPATQERLPALADNSPMAMMLTAQRQGASLADIREMMAIQREYEADTARKAYNEAMALFSAEAIEIIKRKQVDFSTAKGRTQYKHAELSDVVDAVKPVLAKYGFSYRWDTKQTRDWLDVTCILKHRLGHSESCTMGSPPDESGGKNYIQAFKSTKTYLERQTLEAICGVTEKGEDNDGAGVPVTPPIPPELLAAARAEAMKGWKPFSAWIKARTEQERNLLVPESDNLKAAAKAADAKGVAK